MKIALFADYHGGERLWPLLEEAVENQRFDLVVFAGDILDSQQREEEWQDVLVKGKVPRDMQESDDDEGVIDELVYRQFFVNLTGFGVPVVFVPGHIDAPTSRLKEAISEFPDVHNVHEAPFQIGGYTFTGWGGGIGPADVDNRFYCSKEKTLKKHFASGFESDPTKTILLVHTPPISRVDLDPSAEEHVGAKIINEVIEKHQPAFCFCGHVHGTPGQDTIGSTVVVNPGPMFRGRFAFIDLDQNRVMFPTPLKM